MATFRPSFLNLRPVRTWQRIGRLVGYLLSLACLAALLYGVGAFQPVRAADTHIGGTPQFSITLTDEACTSLIARQVLAFRGYDGDQQEKLKKAKVVHFGRPINACWLRVDSEKIVIADDDMDIGFIPWKEFRPVGETKPNPGKQI